MTDSDQDTGANFDSAENSSNENSSSKNGSHPSRSTKSEKAPLPDVTIEDNITAVSERPRPNLEVSVDQNVERAMRVLKRKLIREGLFKDLKTRRYFEKPCEKRKRKKKESMKRIRKEASRQKKFNNGLMQG